MIGTIQRAPSLPLWSAAPIQTSQTVAAPAETKRSAPEETDAPASYPFSYSPELPYVPEGYGPLDLASRSKIGLPTNQEPEFGENEETEETGENDSDDAKSPAEEVEEGKCETCEKRKYQDGSDDPGVSFKTPTNVNPKAAAAAVRGHEHEHVIRERLEAEREGRKVVRQTVTYHTGICPECGKLYVSGGTTETVTAPDPSKQSKGQITQTYSRF